MTTHRMDKLVGMFYTEKSTQVITPPTNEYFDVDYTKLKHMNYYSQSRYKAFFVVPLLFYTFSKEKIHCDINPKLIAYDLHMELKKTLEQEYYKNKLADKHIYIQLIKLPNWIEHKYVSNFIALPTRYSVGSGISVREVTFTSDSGNVVLKCGITDKAGNVLKIMEITKHLDPVYVETYAEGRRKYFIYNGLSILDSKYNRIYKEIITEIVQEL
jgi:hypothetical protein